MFEFSLPQGDQNACVWRWNITVHIPGALPMGSAKDLDTAEADFKAAWKP